MQAALSARTGLLALPTRLGRPSRPRLSPVLAAKKGSSPAEAPVAAPAAAPPSDVPAYFQPAPVPQQYEQGQVQQYQAIPQYGPPPGAAPAKEPSFWSNIPPLVYIGVGVVLAGVLSKIMAVVRGGPQKMQEMMMQQMMQQMMKQMGAPPTGGVSPFGGASPFGAAGAANPFGAAAGSNPFGAAGGSGFPSSFPSMQPAFDTTATPAASSPAAAKPEAAKETASSTTTAAAAKDSSSGGSSSPAAGESKPKKKSAFVDVNAESPPSASSSSTAAAGSNGSASTAPPPPAGMPPPPFSMPPPPAGAAGAGASTGATGVAGTMLDMLKNPEMQKMLYPYLPEPMRNPETFEWMLSNPEYRQQLESMLMQQAGASGSPAMAEMMAGMDMTPEKMQAQFDALGMTPDQFISKVMSDPDLAGMMTNPKIMAAIAECTKNPMAIFNYQNDPEVLRVFEKMSALFPQAAGAGALPTMPPGFGQPPSQQ